MTVGKSASRSVTVIVNATSRSTEHALGTLPRAFDAHGIHVDALRVGRDEREVRRFLKAAVRGGAKTIVVGGGDGTMAHAVDVLARKNITLGVIPLGTGNSFARSLNVPLGDVDAAVGIIARGKTRRVDLGRVNGTYFANFMTIGLSSEIAGSSARPVKNWLGPLAYAFAAIGPILRHDGFRARIRWAGGSLEVRTQDVIIANGRYFGSTPLTADASLTDGKLTLYTVDDPSRLGALKTYLSIGLDDQVTRAGAHVVSSRSFRIKARTRQRISIDGSLLEKTPAHVRVAPAALPVFIP